MIMNNIFKSLIAILVLTSSCQKEPINRFGFDADFERYSRGLSIMNVSNKAEAITLTGEVFVTEGEILVELIAPSGEAVFSSNVISPQILHVNESFEAISGNWKLKYTSLDGDGSIILHLNIDNE